jgi:hypothetical protein
MDTLSRSSEKRSEHAISSSLGLSEQYRAARTLGIIQQLLFLDDIWTQYLAESTTISQPNLQTLEGLTTEMASLLDAFHKELLWLQELVEHCPQELEEAWTHTLAQAPLPYGRKRELQAKMGQCGGFITVARDNMKELIGHVSSERQEIAAKMQQLASGSSTLGDLSDGVRCGLLGAGTVVSAALGQFELAGWFAVIGLNDCF